MFSSLSDRQIALGIKILTILIVVSVLWFAAGYIYNNYYKTDEGTQSILEQAFENVKKSPRDIQARVALADILLASKRLDEAIVQYKQALKISEKYGPALLGLGIAFWQSGKEAKALNTLKKEIKLAEGGANAAMDKYLEQAYFYQGKILLERGSYKEAVDSLQKALKIAPAMSDTYLLLGKAEKGLGKKAQALEHIKKALKLNPGSAEARKELKNLGS